MPSDRWFQCPSGHVFAVAHGTKALRCAQCNTATFIRFDRERSGGLERLEEANKRLQVAWFDRGIKLERLRETLERIAQVDSDGIPIYGQISMYQLAADALASRPSTETEE